LTSSEIQARTASALSLGAAFALATRVDANTTTIATPKGAAEPRSDYAKDECERANKSHAPSLFSVNVRSWRAPLEISDFSSTSCNLGKRIA